MCPQSIVLWERLTCLEQLQFIGEMYGLAAGEARRRGMKLLEALDLAEKRSQQTRTLSGGMQRRLNLAMALVHDPEVVVLDEPEAGLDPQSRVLVREYIQTLARQKTVILTTHNMDEAERLVERVAIIDHGRLLVLDTPEALKWQLGPGDVVEVQVVAFTPSPSPGGRGGEAAVEQVRVRLEGLASEVSLDEAGRRLRVRVRQAVASLPAILAALEAAGLQPGEVSLRANSLEDVFLQLTGRSLRE
jgi:ABC-2 type transport system ATP-binding protein